MITATVARKIADESKLPTEALQDVLEKISTEIRQRANRSLGFLIYNIRENLEQDYRQFIIDKLLENGYQVVYNKAERSLKISW